jgi:hypothetical protein
MAAENGIKMRLNKIVTAIGKIEPGSFDISDESKVRIVIEGANAGNTIIARGRIRGQANYVNLKTILGSSNDIINVSTYDEIELECTVYDPTATSIKVIAGSFNDAGGSTIATIGVPSGDSLTDVESFSLISSDNSISITGNNTTKEIDLAVNSGAFALLNPEEIYVDAQGGDDTSGTGSVVLPFETLEKVLTLTTDTSKHYVVLMAPGDYTSGPVTIPANVSLYGKGANISNQVTIDFLAGLECFPVFDGLSMGDVIMDMSPASIAIATFRDGSYDITRTDTTTGAYFFSVTNSNVSDFSLKGNALFNNVIFVGTGTVENGGQLLMNNCVQGTVINVIGTGVVSLTGCTFSGSIVGTIDAGNTPTVRSDSSSLGYGGVITDANIIDLDSSSFISYAPATPGDWIAPPTEVKSALDELAARPLAESKYIDNFIIADWVSGGGDYSISYPQATHLKGTNPTVDVFELISGIYSPVDVPIEINNIGNVTLKIIQTPDIRFDGLVIIK